MTEIRTTPGEYLQPASWGVTLIGGCLYNFWSLNLFARDAETWRALDRSAEPAIGFVSKFIPIIGGAHAIVLAAGEPERAEMVRHSTRPTG